MIRHLASKKCHLKGFYTFACQFHCYLRKNNTSSFILDILRLSRSFFKENEYFLQKFSPNHQWTIAEPSPAKEGRHGITMTIGGHPGTVTTIDELHWSLSTETPTNYTFFIHNFKISHDSFIRLIVFVSVGLCRI